MLSSEKYFEDKERMERFIAKSLGEGTHYFNCGCDFAVAVEDFGEHLPEVNVVPEDFAEGTSLEWVANFVAKSRGLMPTYLLPEATDDEFESLKASIACYGVIFPIVIDENNIIIDGRLRKQACDELGKECPSVVISNLMPSQKRRLAIDLDLCRKNGSTGDKKNLARRILMSSPSNSDRMIGAATKLDHKTVGALRAQMSSDGEIPHVTLKTGKDGKKYRYSSIRCKSEREAKKAAKILKTLGKNAPTRELRPSRIASLMQEHQQRMASENHAAPCDPDDDIQLLNQDFHTLQLADNSVDMFFTDPPYLSDLMPFYGELAEIAARALKPGGLLLAYVGTHHLDSAIVQLSKHLKFHWQYIVRHTGGSGKSHVRM